MNVLLLLIVIAMPSFAACAWVSPELLRRISVYTNARAAALDASRAAYRRTFDAHACVRPTAAERSGRAVAEPRNGGVA